jgi:hypothetical protein
MTAASASGPHEASIVVDIDSLTRLFFFSLDVLTLDSGGATCDAKDGNAAEDANGCRGDIDTNADDVCSGNVDEARSCSAASVIKHFFRH